MYPFCVNVRKHLYCRHKCGTLPVTNICLHTNLPVTNGTTCLAFLWCFIQTNMCFKPALCSPMMSSSRKCASIHVHLRLQSTMHLRVCVCVSVHLLYNTSMKIWTRCTTQVCVHLHFYTLHLRMANACIYKGMVYTWGCVWIWCKCCFSLFPDVHAYIDIHRYRRKYEYVSNM